ncbi:tetratricopeptide repeat protein [Salicola sp. Rm-C-2C1-2]|uniref:tetratricopeptide repeat protein n=1 Tax=Salicola sp. Rm-C-2C1-2 TaxID=3141321 RepID=UPI0032E48B89
MKRRAEWLAVVIIVLLAGCAGMEPATDSRRVPERVALVTLPLDGADRERLAQVQRELADGNPEAAGQQLASVEADHRFNPEVLMLRAMVARHNKEPRRAIRALERLLQQSPDEAAAANDLALLYRQKGRIEEAAGLLRAALEANAGNPRLHYNLAVLSELYLLDLEQALAHYRRYQALTETKDEEVGLWIRDLERRVE